MKIFVSALIATAVAASLAACGGGGPGAATIVPVETPDDTETNPTDAQTTVPPATYTSQDKLDAFAKINEIRARAGLGLLAQNAKLDQASQAHADWQVLNDTMSHGEAAGTPGFSGTNPWNRITAAGYSATVGGEIIAYPLASQNSIHAITSLSDVIYHRIFLLEPTFVDAGIGINFAGEPRPVNVKIAIPSGSSGQGLPNNAAAIVWPADGSTGVKIAMGPEEPNPIPEISPYAVGFPASVHCPRNKTLSVTSFKMQDANGTPVDAVLRHWTSDPNNVFQSMKCAAGLVPRAHLAQGTTYSVEFIGSIDGTAFQKNWQFTTVSN